MLRPYFKKTHQAWYVNHDKKQHRLGKTEDEALATLAKKMVEWGLTPAPDGAKVQPAGLTLAALVAEFLAWVAKNKSKETHRSYKHYANTWATLHGSVPAASIRGFHVTKLCDEKFAVTDGYSDSVRWQAQKVAKVLFNWAKSEGLIDSNPLAEWKKNTRCGKRQKFLTSADYDKILAAVTDPDFRDLIEVAWECGARPHEIFQAEARHLEHFPEQQQGRLIFRKALGDTVKSKDADATRVVVLSKAAYKIVARLAAKYPAGPLFRRGNKRWTVDICCRRFAALERATGVKTTLYEFRHGFAHHHATIRKTDILSLATLMGHSDTKMLATIYAHAGANVGSMLAAVG